MYVGAFLLMIVGIFYIIKTNPTLPTPIIHQHYSTVQVIEPPMRVLKEQEICTRLDGCPIVNNVCFGVWLWRISGGYSFRDFYRSIWNFLSQPRQWDSRL